MLRPQNISGIHQGVLAWETKRPYIRALQCAMRRCLQKATALRPNAIFFLLHYGTKHKNYGLVFACLSLSCNTGAVSISSVAFDMESEKHTISSPPLKLPGIHLLKQALTPRNREPGVYS